MGERTAESRAMSVEVSAVVLMGVGELELGTESAVESAVESAAGVVAEVAVEVVAEVVVELAVELVAEAAAETAATAMGLGIILMAMLEAAESTTDLASVSAAELVVHLEAILLPM